MKATNNTASAEKQTSAPSKAQEPNKTGGNKQAWADDEDFDSDEAEDDFGLDAAEDKKVYARKEPKGTEQKYEAKE